MVGEAQPVALRVVADGSIKIVASREVQQRERVVLRAVHLDVEAPVEAVRPVAEPHDAHPAVVVLAPPAARLGRAALPDLRAAVVEVLRHET